MGLKKVVEEIYAQARQEANGIINEANDEAKQIISKAMKKTKKNRKKTIANTEALTQEMYRMEIAALNLKTKKSLMNARREIIDEIYAKTIEKVEKINSTQRTKIIKQLVENAMKQLDNPKFIYSNAKDKAIVKKLFPKLKHKQTIDCLGGIILENEDGSVRINKTFEIILEKIKEESLNEISKRVFA